MIGLPPDQLAGEPLTEAAQQHQTLILPGVGTLVWGSSPLEAVTRTETLEYLSYLTLLSRNPEIGSWRLGD